jgi:hypothetical protein
LLSEYAYFIPWSSLAIEQYGQEKNTNATDIVSSQQGAVSARRAANGLCQTAALASHGCGLSFFLLVMIAPILIVTAKAFMHLYKGSEHHAKS